MGFWHIFLTAFVPCTVVAHLWAYEHLAAPDRTDYLAIAAAAYLVPLTASAIISIAARQLRRAVRSRDP